MKKTKIICTMGPNADNRETLKALVENGMDIARFNFSHGDHEEQKARFDLLKSVRDEMKKPIAILLDTKGPEIRTGLLENGGKVVLKEGEEFILTSKEIKGNEKMVYQTYSQLAKDVKPGNTILIDDGLIGLEVKEIRGGDIVCTVRKGGELGQRKGINVPNVRVNLPGITKKDRDDIIFGIEQGIDFIAASFVRDAEAVKEIRAILKEHNAEHVDIIAKIENSEGIENIDKIVSAADGIMVARGDMGVEIPAYEVPHVQKMIVEKCNQKYKPVIIATQMLDSMIRNPRPTRAEVTDVANAIFDGTSAIMLSGETAAGMYPVEALKTMVRIACRAEQDIDYVKRFKTREYEELPDVTNAISHATCTTAHDLGATSIITVTKSGKTARMISKYRPSAPIIGCTTSSHVCRQLNLSWGVVPLLIKEESSTDTLFDHAVDAAEATGIINNGDLVVITAGVPLGVSGTTNMMKVHVVGHVLASGTGITSKSVCARLCVCKDIKDATENFKDGDILVIPQTSNALFDIIKRSSGIITEQTGSNSHAAIVGLAMDLPVLVGVSNATNLLKSGAVVTLDAERGIVCCNS